MFRIGASLLLSLTFLSSLARSQSITVPAQPSQTANGSLLPCASQQEPAKVTSDAKLNPRGVQGFESLSILSPITNDERARLSDIYLRDIVKEIYETWTPLIPESARPPHSEKGCVAISFALTRPGKVVSMKIDHTSGNVSLDRAAWGGISESTYPPLPDAYAAAQLRLRFTFLYNEKPEGAQRRLSKLRR